MGLGGGAVQVYASAWQRCPRSYLTLELFCSSVENSSSHELPSAVAKVLSGHGSEGDTAKREWLRPHLQLEISVPSVGEKGFIAVTMIQKVRHGERDLCYRHGGSSLSLLPQLTEHVCFPVTPYPA